MTFTPVAVSRVPESYPCAPGPLPTLATRDCYRVRAATICPYEFVCQNVCLITFRILCLYLVCVVAFHIEQLTVEQLATRGLHAADQGNTWIHHELRLAHGLWLC